MTIYLGADHRGYGLKEDIKADLVALGHEVRDMGALDMDIGDDYPDFASHAIEALLESGDDGARAILICGSGHGMDMIANKYKGVRSALCFNTGVAKQSREHEDANVLVLPSDWVKEKEAKEIVRVWLETPFGNAERNARRIRKMSDIEGKNFR